MEITSQLQLLTTPTHHNIIHLSPLTTCEPKYHSSHILRRFLSRLPITNHSTTHRATSMVVDEDTVTQEEEDEEESLITQEEEAVEED